MSTGLVIALPAAIVSAFCNASELIVVFMFVYLVVSFIATPAVGVIPAAGVALVWVGASLW